MAQWKPGDVVVLKAGGPEMTIARLMSNDMVYCDWFDSKHTAQGQSFKADALMSPPGPGPSTYAAAEPKGF